ncbi:MAG: hypothetical protein FJX59_03240 [Alphaproteobacteria bacterium]|nr:hypothetical protein [Alphaproteobacteria bacterium]
MTVVQLLLAIAGIAGASVAGAADRIPAAIAAFSQTQLSSDRAYLRLAAAMEAAPGKPFDVKLLIHGELGNDESHFVALRRDRVQIVGVGYQSISTVVPELAIVNAPFLFDSWDELDFVVDNFLGDELNRLLNAKGLHGLRHYGMNWHGFYGRKPIMEPPDVARMRFRALIDSSSQLMARQLGADMIQVGSTEILTGLQTGLLDGGETNELVYVITAVDTEAKHWTYIRNTVSMLGVIVLDSWWKRLTPEQQAVVANGYPDTATARAGIRSDGDKEIARAIGRGATIHELSSEARQRWVAATLPVHKQQLEQIGGESQKLYDLILEGKRAFAARAK